jgi:hypothetical protein
MYEETRLRRSLKKKRAIRIKVKIIQDVKSKDTTVGTMLASQLIPTRLDNLCQILELLDNLLHEVMQRRVFLDLQTPPHHVPISATHSCGYLV